MTTDPQESKDGGVLRDLYGRPQMIAVVKHETPALNDQPVPDGYKDADGRDQVVITTREGGNILDLIAGTGDTVDTFDEYRVIMFSDGTVRAIPAGATPPVTPTGLAVDPRISSVRVSWNAVVGASYYIVRRDGTQVHSTSGTTHTSWRDRGRTVDNTYFYTVQAVDYYGQRSPISSAVPAYIDPASNVAPDVLVTAWPTTAPSDGITLLRVNARDLDAQDLEIALEVDSGTITATDDPSLWHYEP